MSHKYIFNHLLHPQACSLSIMNGVFEKIDVQDKKIIDPGSVKSAGSEHG